jgi:hypothetical protein
MHDLSTKTPPSGASFTPGRQPPGFAELKLSSDDELMAHLQAGCNDALGILFDRYHRLVLSIALLAPRERSGRGCSFSCRQL